MTFNPPYSLRGEAGKALDAGWHTLESLGIHAAGVTLRSLAEDELAFTQRSAPGRLIADDDQWISLADGSGKILLTGIAKRTFQFPQNLYQFSVTNVYRGLTQTPLTDAATRRPYTLYTEADLGATVVSLLGRAQALGLPIQPPATLPEMFAVPKMAFVSASCGSALEDALKWLPDAASRMDYATTPPTLCFSRRNPATAIALDLDAAGHGVTAMTLTAMPEARALFVAFVYAVRDGDLIVNYLTQQAGDDNADAHRSLSIYLSGHERSDLMTGEAMVTANNSLTTAKAALAAANAAITAANATISAALAATLAGVPADGSFNGNAYAVKHDTALAAGLGHVVWFAGSATVYVSGYDSYATARALSAYTWYATATSGAASLVAFEPAGVCPPGTFTDAQLATAGATKTSGFIVGAMMFEVPADGLHGYSSLGGGYKSSFWNATGPSVFNPYVSYGFATLAGTPVDFLSRPLSAITAALRTAAYAAMTPTTALGTFPDKAAYVEAPANLAANYFAAQNWLPYSGSLSFTPTAPVLPAPGDFVSIAAAGLPGAFASMATPVSALQIDLNTGAATVTLGPSARMTFASLQDRLRIPPADNYVPA